VEWHHSQRFALSRTSVIRNAPEESGVYGLLGPDKWVYIGHTANIRKALLQYLRGQMPYVLEWQPNWFVFERHAYRARLYKHKELVGQYQPLCNRSNTKT
jgi:excinuclease UvrABC nuclease subunit